MVESKQASQTGRGVYDVEAVRRACVLLKCFRVEGEVLRLRDLVERSGLSNATAFRILRTLEQQGFIKRVRRNGYRSAILPVERVRYTFGYASQGEDSCFAQEWSDSIIQAAAADNIELMVMDNGFEAETALHNADLLIKAKVDLAIVHQFNEQLAPIISAKFHEARIPFICLGTAHPGATYFGGNNYAAGLIGGRALGRWAKQHWGGQVDELVLAELSMAGPLLRSRLAGVEAGVREFLPELRTIVRLEGSAQFGATLELVRRHLRKTRGRRILLGAVNDPCALGALRGFEEAGWGDECAVMGQGGSVEARAELRRPASRLIGTVGFFPERYGAAIMRLARDILNNKPVPPAMFTRHQLITAANVDHFYPNDMLLAGTAEK